MYNIWARHSDLNKSTISYPFNKKPNLKTVKGLITVK